MLYAYRQAGDVTMAKLVQLTDAAKNESVFVNPAHVRLVTPRSDGGAEVVLDDKIFIFTAETPAAVVKALDNG
jgi:hypothetical protein